MKILVLTFYYAPDLSAGSFRATALVDSLARVLPDGAEIDVVTTLPNRYHSFASDAAAHERRGRVSITRIALPSHQSGMLDQSRAFITFARRALVEARSGYDLVFATSSRLMTAVLGTWIARRSNARLYLDVRDIFVDTIKDVVARPVAWITKPLFSLAERWAVSRADKVNLVSRGFASYFEPRYPGRRFSYFTNGIDDEFLVSADERTPARALLDRREPITVLYAGNLGEGQGLHAILPELACRMGSRVRFQIIGGGGRKQLLEQQLLARGVTNVEMRPPVARGELLELYRAADVLFLHLNDYEAFKKVLPSKIFEYAALGKPIWAGVAGYAADFIRSQVSNASVFPPCDAEEAERTFGQLILADTPRREFLAQYSRANISRAMAADVLSLAQEH